MEGTRNPRVLLVEDQEDARGYLAELLRLEGYDVVTASDGIAGLLAWDSAGADIVVTDLMMPGLNGALLAAALNQRCPALPIIIVSALPPERMEAELRAVAARTVAVLRKPVDLEVLVARMRAALDPGSRVTSAQSGAFAQR